MWDKDKINRRRFSRVKYPCLITLRKNAPPPLLSILTHTENIGVGGVRVIIEKRMAVMIEVDLEIDLKDILPNVISRGRIVWVKEVSSAQEGEMPRYDTGIGFIGLKNEYRRRVQNIVDRFLGKSG